MDAGQLHKLVKVLREVALEATSDVSEGRPNAAQYLVAADLFDHSPTTVSEIASRTGVVQSQVSTIVAALREAGVVSREPDLRDRRRTLLTVPSQVRKKLAADRGGRGIDQALSSYLAKQQRPPASEEVEQLIRLLSELARRLGIPAGPGA